MSENMNNDVLVIGGGMAGMQAALLLAEKDHRVYILEKAPAIGGFFPLLDRQFPTNSCGVCFMSPKPPAYCSIYESEFHENIELLTNAELDSVQGEAGNFDVSLIEKPRCVDIAKCTACGKCTEVCPVETGSELGAGIEKRKAIYLPFAQAIPGSYVVDKAVCTGCGECVKACPYNAIDLEEKERKRNLNAGAIVLAFGFDPFRGEHKGEYGLGRYSNVVSSIQYERMLSYSGPTAGLPGRPSDNNKPRRVAFIQCVGSRDPSCNRDYCSTICCMYATKQAIISKNRDPDFQGTVFYMDVRTVGKDYERYYEQAKNRYGIRYIRSAVSTVKELKRSNRMLITYMSDNGKFTEEEFDMVVLSLGFSAPENIRQDAKKLGIELDEHGFCRTSEENPTETSVPGIFVAGAFREPTDIPETVVQASSAAAGVSELLDDFSKKPVPADPKPQPERPDNEEEPLRIGVFLCDNGGMLAEGLDPEAVVAGVKDEDDVVCVEKVEVSVLDQATGRILQVIEEQSLNRIVLAGHKGMALRRALDKDNNGSASVPPVECANIGEQCADVHADRATATAKARMLVRAGIRKARAAERSGGRTPLNSRILVVGGGIAGMSSSLSLAQQGMKVTLIEKTDVLGGNALKAVDTLKGADIPALIKKTIKEVEAGQEIDVLKSCEFKGLTGTWGDFRAKLVSQEAGGEAVEKELTCGAVIFATGGHEIETDEYLYGQDDRVVTQRQLDAIMANGKPEKIKSVVMIQCVGSRDENHPYCSRVCCGHAVKNSLKLKKAFPDADVYVLNRDVRTYGFAEQKYHEARSKGVLFVRYDTSAKPAVSKDNGNLKVSFLESITGGNIEVDADLVVLSTGIVAEENNAVLATHSGIEVNDDGFFAEANPKAAPLDAVARGKYFCGLCHSPNHIEDVICQGKAAAARASALLWQGYGVQADSQAYVNDRRCSGCGLCVSACPYDARVIDEVSNKALVREALCKGCGTCVISCPNGASQQYDFERETMMEVMDEILD